MKWTPRVGPLAVVDDWKSGLAPSLRSRHLRRRLLLSRWACGQRASVVQAQRHVHGVVGQWSGDPFAPDRHRGSAGQGLMRPPAVVKADPRGGNGGDGHFSKPRAVSANGVGLFRPLLGLSVGSFTRPDQSLISFQSFELPLEPLSSGPSCLQSLLSPPTSPSSCRQSWRVSRRSPRSSRRSPRSSRRSSRRSMRRVSARTMFPFWNTPLPANADACAALMPAYGIMFSAIIRTGRTTIIARRHLQVIRFLH